MDNESKLPSLRISEHDAQRLIARALELDVQRSDELTLDQLRTAAADVGISPEAFDAALQELKTQSRRPPSWHLAKDFSSERLRALLLNAVPIAASYVTLAVLAHAWSATDLSWLVRKAITPAVMLGGALFASRVPARGARFLLSGFGIATGVEFIMDLLQRAPSLHGAVPHFAVLGASFVALWFGTRKQHSDAEGEGRALPGETHTAASSDPNVSEARIARWLRARLASGRLEPHSV